MDATSREEVKPVKSIIVIAPEIRKDNPKWVVTCDEHGEIGRQTGRLFALDRAWTHVDEGCKHSIYYLIPDKITKKVHVGHSSGRWGDGPAQEPIGTRSSRALAVKLARKHSSKEK